MSDYDYDELYSAEDPADSPPWEIGKPQPALAEALAGDEPLGQVLDAGCGTAELGLSLAPRASAVLGFDISEPAVREAARKAKLRGIDNAAFVVADATDLSTLDFRPDVVVDSGLLHSLDDADQVSYLGQLAALTEEGATLHVLAVSLEAGEGWGLTREGLTDLVVAAGWTVDRVGDVITDAEMGEQRFSLPSYLLTATRLAG